MAEYRFLTTWVLDAPREAVWEEIYHPERWPEWWRGVRSVRKLAEGDGDGVGSLYEHEWRSRLPYPVRFRVQTTRVELPHLIEGSADGELAGTGRWRFFAGRETAVTYEWHVRTTRRWMNALAPVARPVFAANHDWVMRSGGEGLARLLGGCWRTTDGRRGLYGLQERWRGRPSTMGGSGRRPARLEPVPCRCSPRRSSRLPGNRP